MSKKYIFIWDLDGTLFDSYKTIVPSALEAMAAYGIKVEEKALLDYCINYSLTDFFKEICEKHQLSLKELTERCDRIREKRIYDIEPMPHTKEVLSYLCEQGVDNYVYTHRGETTYPILEHLEIREYFKDVVTASADFPRKPAPDGLNYLIEKHSLKREDCFYVGDRKLDMECAHNAHVKCILYIPSYSVAKASGREYAVIRDLKEIMEGLYESIARSE